MALVESIDPTPGRREEPRRDRTYQVVELTSSNPWIGRDLQRLGLSFAVGAIGLAVSWVGVDGSTEWSTQTGWIAFGVGAVSVSAIAAGGWVLVGVRSVRRLRGLLLGGLRAASVAHGLDGEPPQSGDVVVTGAGMTMFHDPACLLVAGKDVAVIDRSDVGRRGLHACGVCRC